MEETLRAWREGERLLETLPPLTPDHETVRLAIIQLRSTYQRVATLKAATHDVLASNRALMEEALDVIRAVQGRLTRDPV
jgi:hypothetical protein